MLPRPASRDGAVCPPGGWRPGAWRDQADGHESGERLRRVRRAPAEDAGQLDERGARERAAVRRDATAAQRERAACGELAIINSVQEGLAAELDFRAIVDLVGNKIAEIFGTRYMYLALVDKATNLVTMPFWLEHGERFPVEPFPLGTGLTGEVIRTRQPLLITDNLQERAAQLGAKQVGDKDSADTGKSYVGVPILKGEEAFGVIGVYGRHANAFGESDVRLLQTLAN